MKNSIHDFIRMWKQYDGENPNVPSWTSRFRSAGYYTVKIKFDFNKNNFLEDMHCWVKENIGEKHYAYTGSNIFWFETKDDVTKFLSRWS